MFTKRLFVFTLLATLLIPTSFASANEEIINEEIAEMPESTEMVELEPTLIDEETLISPSTSSTQMDPDEMPAQNFSRTKVDEIEPDLSSGAATFTYPIIVPPGRNGMTPQLALTYSSQRKNNSNIAGYGWELTRNRIYRAPNKGIWELYDDSVFVLELNGQSHELIQLPGGNGEFGEYALKVDDGSFLKIEYWEDGRWYVDTKDGHVYDFRFPLNDPDDENRIYSWSLASKWDKQGNRIYYYYLETNGAMLLYKVEYGGTSTGIDDIYEIRFQSILNNLQNRDDIFTHYSKGFEETSLVLIDSIDVKMLGTGELIKSYVLDYETGDNGVRSMLASITERGWNAARTEMIDLPPTEFDYSISDRSWTRDREYRAEVNFSNMRHWAHGNFNGDAYLDFIYLSENHAGDPVQRLIAGGPNGFYEDNSTWNFPQTPAPPHANDIIIRSQDSIVLDANNDGYDDIFTYRGDHSINPYIPEMFQMLNTDGEGLEYIGRSEYLPWRWSFESDNYLFFETNGDGLLDIVLSHNCDNNCLQERWFGNGETGFEEDTSFQYEYLYERIGGLMKVDVNNDGLTDALYPRKDVQRTNGEWLRDIGKLWVNDGNGGYEEVASNYVMAKDEMDSMRAVDVNGDGLVDLYKYTSSGAGHRVYLGTGSGWVEDESYTDEHLMGRTSGNVPPIFTDFDADGLIDSGREIWEGHNGYWITNYYFNNGEVPDLLKTIRLPEGGEVRFEYGSSAHEVDSAGNQANTDLPFVVQVVKTMTKDDGLGNISEVNFTYERGEDIRKNLYDRPFAGFGKVQKNIPGISRETFYFHQGDDYEFDFAAGEFEDHIDKMGKMYLYELQDDERNEYYAEITKWNRQEIGDRAFVYPEQKVTRLKKNQNELIDSAIGYEYDAFGNVIRETDYGLVETDTRGVFQDIGDDNIVTERQFISSNNAYLNGLVSEEKRFDGESRELLSHTQFLYDGLSFGNAQKGNITKVKQKVAEPNTWIVTEQNRYNDYGNVIQSWDANRRRTVYQYDANQMYPTRITNPQGHRTNIVTDYTVGLTSRTSDANGYVTEMDYDTFGRMDSVRESSVVNNQLIETTRYSYDTNFPQSITIEGFDGNGGGTMMREFFDGLGRTILTKTRIEPGKYLASESLYDVKGRIAGVLAPFESSKADYEKRSADPQIRYVYDYLDREIEKADKIGVVRTNYDGLTRTITDEQGKQVRFTDDIRGNLLLVEQRLKNRWLPTIYEYDENGNLTRLIDADGNYRQFKYDLLSRRVSMTDLYEEGSRDFASWTYVYDRAGNVTEIHLPDGSTTQFDYDKLHRMVMEDNTATPDVDIIYEYDKGTRQKGQLTKAVRGIIETNYSYDRRGNLISETKKIGPESFTTSFEYDELNRPMLTTLPNGDVVQTIIDDAGRAKEALFNRVAVAQIEDYNVYSQPKTVRFNNGVVTTFKYEGQPRSRLTVRQTTANNKKLENTQYRYKKNDLISMIFDRGIRDGAGKTFYSYDDLSRLTKADFTLQADKTQKSTRKYQYDDLGNITNHPVHGPISYGSFNPHAITTLRGADFTYDANGNVTLDERSREMSWNYRNELLSLQNGKDLEEYVYDHNGSRVLKIHPNGKAYYLGAYIKEADREEVHLSLADRPVFMQVVDKDGTKDRYMHADHLSSIAFSTDENGNLDTSTTYHPFGSIHHESSQSTTENRFDYINKERDESGLNYLEARYLNTDIGRFYSLDPVYLDLSVEQWFTDPQAQNAYSYSKNDPINLYDPSGRFFKQVALGVYNHFTPTETKLDHTTSILPVISETRDVVELISGQDVFSGESLTNTDKALTVGGLLVAGPVSGKHLRTAKNAGEKVHSVYQSIDAEGLVEYVGITNDFTRRKKEHLKNGRLIEPLEGLENLTRQEARGVEQVLIETYGMKKNGGSLSNKRNSISPKRDYYDDSVKVAKDILNSNSPGGFVW